MPVTAVTRGGKVTVSVGSQSAMSGTISVLPTPYFAERSFSEMTAQIVLSLPVPAVVGTAIRGAPGFSIRPSPS